MEWALIFVLSSGIWDTGLRYNTYADCYDGSTKAVGGITDGMGAQIRFAEHMHSKGSLSTQDKDLLVRNFIFEGGERRVELEKSFRCMPSKPE